MLARGLHSCLRFQRDSSGGRKQYAEASALQSGTMRIDPLFTGRAVSVLIAGLIGVGAVTGWLHTGLSSKQGDARPADPGRAPVPPSTCALCGTVESIRTVEVRDEAGGAGAAAGGPDACEPEVGGSGTAGTLLGAGGAIAGGEIEKSGKKR